MLKQVITQFDQDGRDLRGVPILRDPAVNEIRHGTEHTFSDMHVRRLVRMWPAARRTAFSARVPILLADPVSVEAPIER